MAAPLDRIWEIVSDVDNDPQFWQDLHSVTTLRRNGNVIERVATVGFRNSRSSQTVILDPKKSVRIVMTKGPMTGDRIIELKRSGERKTVIEVAWTVELSGIPSFIRKSVQERLGKGTEEALARIEKAAA